MTSCRVDNKDARMGDVVVFKRSGPVSFLLGGILRLFEPRWDFWGWHTGFIAGRDVDLGLMLCESLAPGVELTYLAKYPGDGYRTYRWLEPEPENGKVVQYLSGHLGKKYDVAVYFWTAAQYFLRHFWNRRIPRLLDDRYTCWENVTEFCQDMGKPVISRYDCPIITDVLRAFGEIS